MTSYLWRIVVIVIYRLVVVAVCVSSKIVLIGVMA